MSYELFVGSDHKKIAFDCSSTLDAASVTYPLYRYDIRAHHLVPVGEKKVSLLFRNKPVSIALRRALVGMVEMNLITPEALLERLNKSANPTETESITALFPETMGSHLDGFSTGRVLRRVLTNEWSWHNAEGHPDTIQQFLDRLVTHEAVSLEEAMSAIEHYICFYTYTRQLSLLLSEAEQFNLSYTNKEDVSLYLTYCYELIASLAHLDFPIGSADNLEADLLKILYDEVANGGFFHNSQINNCPVEPTAREITNEAGYKALQQVATGEFTAENTASPTAHQGIDKVGACPFFVSRSVKRLSPDELQKYPLETEWGGVELTYPHTYKQP